MISQSLYIQGCLADIEGNKLTARCIHEECLMLRRELGDRQGIVASLNALGRIVSSQSDCEHAAALFRESLSLGISLGHRRGIVISLFGLAGVAHANRQPGQAARLLGAGEALRETIPTGLSPDERCSYDCHLAAVRAALGQEPFSAAWDEGRAMTLEQAIEYALDTSSGETILG